MDNMGGDDKGKDVDRDQLVGVARDLLDAVADWFPCQLHGDTAGHLVWTSGLLARCHALLSGMTTLTAQHEDDSVPALYRPLLETYLTGLYALFGRDEAVAVLHAAWEHDVHEMERSLGRNASRPESAKQLLVSDYRGGTGLVDRVDDLLKQVEPSSSGWARRAYKYHYKTTSFHDSHGGLGSTVGHMFDEEDGSTTVSLRRGGSAAALHVLAMAVSMVLGLAVQWAGRAGQDLTAVTAIQQRWALLYGPEPDS